MSQPRCAHWWCVLALLFAFTAAPAAAQQAQSPLSLPAPLLLASASLTAANTTGTAPVADSTTTRDSSLRPPAAPVQPRFPLMGSMYASFAALQVLDVHSTSKALAAGARESNPLLPFAGNTALMIGVKAASSAGTIYLANRIAKKNRAAAVILMAAFNSAYSVIVAHNYRVAGSLAR
jgi:hypothetical protein